MLRRVLNARKSTIRAFEFATSRWFPLNSRPVRTTGNGPGLSAQLERDLEASQFRPLGIAAREPLAQSHSHVIASLPGQPSTLHDIEFAEVGAGYFDALGIPILAGRNFQTGDDAGNAIIVNQSLARQLFDGANPLGKTIAIGNTVREIVGVVRDAHLTVLDHMVPLFFQPFSGAQVPCLLVRADSPGAAGLIAGIARRIEPRVRTQVRPLSENLDRALSGSRAGAAIAGILGVFALTLAAIGMSGVFAFLVAQRTKEIGIRMALGAAPKQVVALVLAGTARAAIAGLAVGYLASMAVAKWIENICTASVPSILVRTSVPVRSSRLRESPPPTSPPAAPPASIRSVPSANH